MWWVPLAVMAANAALGEYQGAKNRKALKDQAKEQARRDRINMIASAYGVNQGLSAAPLIAPNTGAAQGAFAGLQMAMMNKDLWSSNNNPVTTPATSETDQLANLYAMTQGQQDATRVMMQNSGSVPAYQQSPYGAFAPGQYNGFIPQL